MTRHSGGAEGAAARRGFWVLCSRAVASPAGRVARQSLVYTVGSMLPQAVSIVLLPIFTRYLNASDYGILAYSLTIAAFFSTFGTFAIQPFIVRQYWVAKANGDVAALLSTVFLFLLVHNLVLLGAACLLLPLSFDAIGVTVSFAPYVQLALVSAVLQALAIVPMWYFRVTERASVYVGLGFLASLLGGGFSVYLIVGRGMGVMGRLYGQLAADAIMLAIDLVILARLARVAWRPAYVREAFRYCLPIIPAQFLAMFSSMADRLILERWVPLGALGVYSVGAALASTAPLLTSGVFAAIQPQVFRLASEARLDGQMLVIKRYLMWLLLLLMCLMIALSRDLVALLAGPAFQDSYKVACLLVAGILVQSFITNVPSHYLTAVGKTQYETPARLAGAIAGLVAMVTLVPIVGIYGAGLGSIAAALTTLGAYSWFLRRETTLAWRFDRDVAALGVAAAAGLLLLQIEIPALLLSVTAKLAIIALAAMVCLAWASTSVRSVLATLPLPWSVERP